MPKPWKLTRVVAPILIVGAMLWFLSKKFDGRNVFEAAVNADHALLFFGMTILFSAHFFTILRWKNSLAMIDYPLDILGVAKSYLACLPITKLTPAFSGDFARALMMRSMVPISSGSGVIFLEGLLDISVLMLSVIVGAFWTGRWLLTAFSVMFLIMLALSIYALNIDKMRTALSKYRKINNFLLALSLIYKNPFWAMKLLFYTFCAWLGTILFFKFAFLSFGTEIPFSTLFLLQPIAVLATLLPITISGVGVRESAMLVLYVPIVTASSTLLAGLAYSFATVIIFPILCLPFTVSIMMKLPKK